MEWHDAELPKFFSDLIGDLRDEIWRLKGAGNVSPVEDFCDGLQDAVGGNLMIQTLQQKLELQNAEMKQLKTKYKTLLFGFDVFVLGLVLGKISL